MDMDNLISPEAKDSFIKTPTEWRAAFDELNGDRDAVLDLAHDLPLDSELSAVDMRDLLKHAAKLAGTTYRDLRKDVELGAVENEPRRDHLSLAREAVASFGDQGLIFAQGEFWAWQPSGVWGIPEEQTVRKAATAAVEGNESVTNAVICSVTRIMEDVAHVSGTQFDKPADRRINCLNGTLEYTEGAWRLREHRQSDYLTSLVPVAYDPTATCPRFDRFLAEVFEGDEDSEDKAQAVLEMMGYSLLQSCRLEKFIILIGKGANGKSVLLEVVRHLVGPDQASAVEPARLNEGFQRAHLRGKLVNIVPELPVGAKLADGAMKAFTSGDPVNGERKGGDPFDFNPYATFWTGTNSMPHTRDLSDGMFRRALIVPFNRKFGENERELGLAEKLCMELPGILTRALQALGRALDRGYITNPASSRAALAKWRTESDQVALFLDECCSMDDKSSFTPTQELLKAYKGWAEAWNHRLTVAGTEFGKRLADCGLIAGRQYWDGKQLRGFFGVELNRTS